MNITANLQWHSGVVFNFLKFMHSDKSLRQLRAAYFDSVDTIQAHVLDCVVAAPHRSAIQCDAKPFATKTDIDASIWLRPSFHRFVCLKLKKKKCTKSNSSFKMFEMEISVTSLRAAKFAFDSSSSTSTYHRRNIESNLNKM